ncbi:capsular biosynthesis protein [Sinirhodobacter populi]|nr:capsular biosynthesis protein [Sinirhodobacter populi]
MLADGSVQRSLRLSGETDQAAGVKRTILLLQGHPSWFWGELADELGRRGWRVLKVHFCLADRLMWGRREAITYRGRFRDWESWLRAYCVRENVSEILYFADRMPYHVGAQNVGRLLGISCRALEFGYLRPDWLTFERNGMGRFSHFPKDPDVIRRLADITPEPAMVPRYTHIFSTEAVFEVSYNLLLSLGRPLYLRYNADRPYWPAIEYLSWLPVLATEKRRLRQAKEIETWLIDKKVPFNLIALQINTDYQIRDNSPYNDLKEFLSETLSSFARHAPKDRHIVVKIHPLDNGLHMWFQRVARYARRLGISDRVHVIRGGDLTVMLQHTKGLVVVNSTVGLHGLRNGCPVCATGDAVYRLPGLTHMAGLDSFWTAPEPVDPGWFKTFRRALSRIQVKGSFFNPEGRRVAIAEICRRLDNGEADLPDWADVPPQRVSISAV